MSKLNVTIEALGSSGNKYTVKLYTWQDKTKLHCTCQAGSNGQLCKHRVSALAGEYQPHYCYGPEWDAMQSALQQTGLKQAYFDYDATKKELEKAAARIKSEISQNKERFTRLLEKGG